MPAFSLYKQTCNCSTIAKTVWQTKMKIACFVWTFGVSKLLNHIDMSAGKWTGYNWAPFWALSAIPKTAAPKNYHKWAPKGQKN